MAPKAKEQDMLEDAGPGVAPQKTCKPVEKAASKYVDIRDARMALTEQEVDAKAVLMKAMHENNLTRYKFDGYLVEIKPGEEKVKVKSVDDENAGDTDE